MATSDTDVDTEAASPCNQGAHSQVMRNTI